VIYFPIVIKREKMAQEIERKFLVLGDFKQQAVAEKRMIQGYLSSVPERTVRVRISGESAFLTIKGKSSDDGLTRYEWEKEIAVQEAQELLQLCEKGIIDKTRYVVPVGEHDFEVDEFHGDNEGLILAEVELKSLSDDVKFPDWLGQEVTGDVRYYNAELSRFPFREWR
jgi:adenylate cyclase